MRGRLTLRGVKRLVLKSARRGTLEACTIPNRHTDNEKKKKKEGREDKPVDGDEGNLKTAQEKGSEQSIRAGCRTGRCRKQWCVSWIVGKTSNREENPHLSSEKGPRTDGGKVGCFAARGKKRKKIKEKNQKIRTKHSFIRWSEQKTPR